MHTHVTFHHQAEFVPFLDDDGVLSAQGISWFVDLLERIPDLDVNPANPDVCKIVWYEPRETQKAEPFGHATPTSLPHVPNHRP